MHPVHIDSLGNLALVLSATDRYKEAEQLYRRAVKFLEEVGGEEYSKYIIYLSTLADLLRDTCQYEEAEKLYNQVIEIAERRLNKAQPNYVDQLIIYAGYLNSFAHLLARIGRYKEAELLYWQVIEIDQQFGCARDPEDTLSRLMILPFCTKKWVAIEKPKYYIGNVVEIDKETIGEDRAVTR